MSFAAASSAPEQNPDAVVAGMVSVLRALAAAFIAAFGDPAAMIKAGAIWGKTRERALRFLHDMECVVRRLLLLRAALYPAPALRPVRPSKPRIVRAREGDAEKLFGPSEDPALWRVNFRMPIPAEPHWMLGGFRAHEDSYELGHRVEAGEKAAGTLQSIGYWADDPRPLAERFEALRRVIEDHEHYSARLAQRLYGWRGREERRQLFLHGLCAATPIANEAGLPDADWAIYGAARPLAQRLIPVFSETLRPPKAPETAPDVPASSCAPAEAAPAPEPAAETAPETAREKAGKPGFDELIAELEANLKAIIDTT